MRRQPPPHNLAPGPCFEQGLALKGFHPWEIWLSLLENHFAMMDRRGLFDMERRGPRGGKWFRLRADLVPLYRTHLARGMLNRGRMPQVKTFEEEARCLGLMP